MIGEKFNMLTCIEETESEKHGKHFLFKCDCGNYKVLTGSAVRAGNAKSCGCVRRSKYYQMIGKKYNRLYVISKSDKTEKNRAFNIYCKCDCGNYIHTRAEQVYKSRTKSCGCYGRQQKSELLKKRNTKHGMFGKKVYTTWQGMKQRCNYPKSVSYVNYGGRGVRVCEEWNNSFEQFYKDMGDPPTKDHQLDRINNEGNYEPNNCRWVTRSENCINKRGRSLKNIRKNKCGNYEVVIKRRKTIFFKTVSTLEHALELRGKIINEFKDNPEEWIRKYKR